MIGRAGHADAHAEVELPVRRKVQVKIGNDLLFLQRSWIEIAHRPEDAIIFDSGVNLPRNVVSRFEVRRENKALAGRGPFERFVDAGIEGQVPAADLLIDDRPDFERPRIGGKITPLISELEGNADAYRPLPLLRSPHPRTNMTAHPLIALARSGAGKDIESGFEPRREPVRNLDGLMKLMFGR